MAKTAADVLVEFGTWCENYRVSAWRMVRNKDLHLSEKTRAFWRDTAVVLEEVQRRLKTLQQGPTGAKDIPAQQMGQRTDLPREAYQRRTDDGKSG